VPTLTPEKLTGRYLIGRYTVDFDSRRVCLNGTPLDLHWRGFEALRELAAAHGHIVHREHLFQVLWPGAVVDESNLGKVMSQLRRKLDEGDPGTEYVETLPRAGYRLAAPVSPIEPEAVAPSAHARPRRRFRLWTAAAALAAAILGWAGHSWWCEHSRIQEALEAERRGEQLLRSRDPASVPEAVGLLRRATELNPKSAVAFGALAHALNRQGAHVGIALNGKAPALMAAAGAVELDPGCGSCNGTLGLFLMSHAWQWDRAQTHPEKAIRISPDNFNIRPSYALLLLVLGRTREALDQIDIAIKGAPFHAGYHVIRARVLYFLQRYPEAVEAADRAAAIQRTEQSAWEWRSQALLQMRQAGPGIDSMTEYHFPQHRARAAAAVRQGGTEAGLRVLIEAAGDARTHSWRRARWKFILGDQDGALDELDIAHQAHLFELMFVAVDPVFERLRGHHRFQRLLEDMRLRDLPSRQTSERTAPGGPATP
jgi:DNA-binding winged helix-turn-helix (wHTH) protein